MYPQCHSCNKHIAYLLAKGPQVTDIFEVMVNKKTKAIQYTKLDPCVLRSITFHCPECEALLFISEQQALAFLKGTA